jgi:hypothetical protein
MSFGGGPNTSRPAPLPRVLYSKAAAIALARQGPRLDDGRRRGRALCGRPSNATSSASRLGCLSAAQSAGVCSSTTNSDPLLPQTRAQRVTQSPLPEKPITNSANRIRLVARLSHAANLRRKFRLRASRAAKAPPALSRANGADSMRCVSPAASATLASKRPGRSI